MIQMPPEIKAELNELQGILVDINIRHQTAARIEAEPIIERIVMIHNCYPQPIVVDTRQIKMPFIESEF